MTCRLLIVAAFFLSFLPLAQAAVECFDDPKGSAETSLIERARQLQVACVQASLTPVAGMNVNAQDKDKKTILNIVSDLRTDKPASLAIARLAILHGVEINHKDASDNTALCNATFEFAEMAKLLVDSGADVNAACHEGHTPIVRATDIATLKLLVDRGADVNANQGAPLRQHANWVILHSELKEATFDQTRFDNDLARVKFLLDHGARVQPGLEESERLADLDAVAVENYKAYQFLTTYKK